MRPVTFGRAVQHPPRPESYPDKWIVVFWGFNELGTEFGPTIATPCLREGQAMGLAQDPEACNIDGSVRVQFGYAYPPVDVDEQPYVATFVIR